MIKFNAQKLAAVAMCQSTEQTRYYLCGVYFEGNKAVATDGHMLTVAIDHNSEAPNGDGAIMPVSKKAITAMKAQKADYVVFNNDQLTVINADGKTFYIEPSVPIDGTFPDWRRVLPSELGEVCAVGVLPWVLARIAATAKVLNNSAARITGVALEDPQAVLYSGDSEVFSVAMPCRGVVAKFPDWLS